MALDLSFLDNETAATTPGLPAQAALSAFEEDPGNPRTEFDGPEFDELVEDIRQRGILQPVVVARMPSGKLRIRFGARRFRAARRLGLASVPYVITEDSRQLDDYAQVSENEKRKGLEPLELASFIEQRRRLGETNKAIAGKLGIDPGAVTHLLALVEPPRFIQELYETRRCRLPVYLYKLRGLHQRQAGLVEARARSVETVDIGFLNALAAEVERAESGADDRGGAGVVEPSSASGGVLAEAQPARHASGARRDRRGGQAASARTKAASMGQEREPQGELRSPVLLGNHDARAVVVDLILKPTEDGLVFVTYQGDKSRAEVAFVDLRITHLVDGDVL